MGDTPKRLTKTLSELVQEEQQARVHYEKLLDQDPKMFFQDTKITLICGLGFILIIVGVLFMIFWKFSYGLWLIIASIAAMIFFYVRYDSAFERLASDELKAARKQYEDAKAAVSRRRRYEDKLSVSDSGPSKYAEGPNNAQNSTPAVSQELELKKILEYVSQLYNCQLCVQNLFVPVSEITKAYIENELATQAWAGQVVILEDTVYKIGTARDRKTPVVKIGNDHNISRKDVESSSAQCLCNCHFDAADLADFNLLTSLSPGCKVIVAGKFHTVEWGGATIKASCILKVNNKLIADLQNQE